MRQRGLIGRCRRRWTKTTISDPEVAAVDLLRRAFGPGTVELDRIYVGDIAYIWTWQGWAYLATVIDLASRRVVGWAVGDHMRAELVCDALRMAIVHPRPAPGLLFHSEPGSTPAPSSPPCWPTTTSPSRCRGLASAGTTPWPKVPSPP
jgi:putative transposase